MLFESSFFLLLERDGFMPGVSLWSPLFSVFFQLRVPPAHLIVCKSPMDFFRYL